MDSNDLLAALLGPAMNTVPHLLLCTVGLVLCLLRRPALGAAGVYGSLGFGLLICGSLLGLGSHVWLMWMRQSGETSVASMSLSMGVFGAIATVIHAIALGLLIAAILVRRPAQAA